MVSIALLELTAYFCGLALSHFAHLLLCLIVAQSAVVWDYPNFLLNPVKTP